MKFTLSWLKDHLDTEASLEEIGRTLTMIGLEVEGIHDPGSELRDLIVGHVKTAEQHPDADRLRICMVDTGSEVLQVICGAPNARAGIKVALARPGNVIPTTGEALKKGKIRGVESQGMLCSARELGLGDDHAGIIELDPAAPTGAPLTKVMSLDPVIEIAVTPNRADCLGVRGVARDLAAAGLGTLKADPYEEPVPGTFQSPIAVRRQFPEGLDDACPMFVGRYIRGVKNGESPRWLKDRLTAIGLRPISPLVDITNYVTMDRARPLHVFDADKLTGDIIPRMARTGETLEALNDKTYTLDDGMVVIADEAGPQGIGGIIGGVPTSCTEDTVNVFVESALFDPRRIAATARRLGGIESDAKHRFERGVDPASAVWGAELATRLIQEICGGDASELVLAGQEPEWQRSVSMRPERVDDLIGISVEKIEMRSILSGLGCDVSELDGLIVAQRPSWRADLEEEHDLVEEVARIHGYDNIQAVPLPREGMPKVILTARQKNAMLVKRALGGRGMLETVTWSFMPREDAALFDGGAAETLLANPISSDLDAMRPSILPNLISAAGRNAARGFADVALFEVGPQFHGGEPGQQKFMATGIRAGRSGPRHWAKSPRDVDVFDAKADAMAALAAAGAPTGNLQISTDAPGWYHPGRSGQLRLGPTVLAAFGELHPRVLKELDVKGPVAGFEVFLDAVPLPKPKATKAKPLLKASNLQAVERDFAFVVDTEVPADTLVRAAMGADRQLIRDVSVFDLYEGPNMPEGKKSIAISVTLQPTKQTLTEEEIELVSKKVISSIEKSAGGTLRG